MAFAWHLSSIVVAESSLPTIEASSVEKLMAINVTFRVVCALAVVSGAAVVVCNEVVADAAPASARRGMYPSILAILSLLVGLADRVEEWLKTQKVKILQRK